MNYLGIKRIMHQHQNPPLPLLPPATHCTNSCLTQIWCARNQALAACKVWLCVASETWPLTQPRNLCARVWAPHPFPPCGVGVSPRHPSPFLSDPSGQNQLKKKNIWIKWKDSWYTTSGCQDTVAYCHKVKVIDCGTVSVNIRCLPIAFFTLKR